MIRKGKIIRRTVYAVGYLLIAAIVAVTVFFFLSSSGGNIAFIGGRTVMWVRTPSMSPLIPDNTFILVEQAGPETVEPGDVIVFISDDPEILGQYNTHRVVEVYEGGKSFVTKGDSNTSNDAYRARAEKVIGKYVRNLDIISAFGRVLSGKIGLVLVLTVVFAILMAMYVPVMSSFRRKSASEAEAEKKKLIDELVKAEIEKLKSADESGQTAEAAESEINSDNNERDGGKE